MGFFDRLKKAFNVFVRYNPEEAAAQATSNTISYFGSYRPDRTYFTNGTDRSIVSAIYNRMAVDCSSRKIRHVVKDTKTDKIKEEVNSGLSKCFKCFANKDQTGVFLIRDIVETMFDDGVVAVVPTIWEYPDDARPSDVSPSAEGILSLRTGRIKAWYPDYVDVDVYNDESGKVETVCLPKKHVAIIENPYYPIMNDKNSVAQRLIKKLNMLDAIDEECSSGKMNLIIQLPYVVKSSLRKEQAETRRKEIEDQLRDNRYGIAYTDGTEKITQLNRPLENNLLDEIKFLSSMLHSQLGVTSGILDGTADSSTMNNYYIRMIGPILTEIAQELQRKFLTEDDISEGQAIITVNSPIDLLPINEIAKSADTFIRNEILSANEVRMILGIMPSPDPKSDELRNPNMPEEKPTNSIDNSGSLEEGENQNGK